MTKAIGSAGGEKSAARHFAETFSAETLDSLIKDAVKSGTPDDGADGLLNEPTKSVLERALQTEMTHHLGYETGDPGRARVIGGPGCRRRAKQPAPHSARRRRLGGCRHTDLQCR
ncbi:transposase [Mycolicibacterium sp. PAM1]|uniref:hypothetical protein n=1 Tax=Mycolicibacterium sp. PAM1 TaxID=2853535 RepID=UPI0013014F7C|nr:transposase [Mycolicibacterium sp. PAM1]